MTTHVATGGHTGPHDIALPRGTVGRLRRLAVLAGAAVGDAVNFAGALGAVAVAVAATLTSGRSTAPSPP